MKRKTNSIQCYQKRKNKKKFKNKNKNKNKTKKMQQKLVKFLAS